MTKRLDWNIRPSRLRRHRLVRAGEQVPLAFEPTPMDESLVGLWNSSERAAQRRVASRRLPRFTSEGRRVDSTSDE